MEYGVARLDGSDKILDILSDKDLEHEGTSFFQEDVGYVENGEVDLDGSILVHSGLTGGGSGYIRSQTIEFISL